MIPLSSVIPTDSGTQKPQQGQKKAFLLHCLLHPMTKHTATYPLTALTAKYLQRGGSNYSHSSGFYFLTEGYFKCFAVNVI